MGPTSLVAAARGEVAATGLVAHWCGPQAISQSQYFSKNPEKIIFDFQDHRRTFIFRVLFSGTLKQKTGKTKLNLSFFF